MNLKWIGAVCVIIGCGGWGFLIAYSYLNRIQLIRSLIGALDYMECELQYRCTALPQLCRQVGNQHAGRVGRVFLALADELEAQISPNVERCMAAVLHQNGDLPKALQVQLKNLGNSLGRFDIPGQLRGLESARKESRENLDYLLKKRDSCVRSYQTLGLCAGAAIAILFV